MPIFLRRFLAKEHHHSETISDKKRYTLSLSKRATWEEEMRKTDGCGMKKFGTSDGSEKTIAIVLGNRWWPQAGSEEEETRQEQNMFVCRKNKNTLQM